MKVITAVAKSNVIGAFKRVPSASTIHYLVTEVNMRGRVSTSRQSMSAGGSSSAVETPLPLQLALTWLVVALYTTNGNGENQVHSATFIASILEIITTEILEVC
jgi:hypothetical protein